MDSKIQLDTVEYSSTAHFTVYMTSKTRLQSKPYLDMQETNRNVR